MFVGPIPVTWCSFYIFLFFCFLQPPIPKLTEPRGKKKKNLETQTHRTQWKKKKKKKKMKKTKPDPTWKGKEEKKKKKKKKNPNSPNLVEKKKLRLDSDRGTLSVGLIMEMPLKTELCKLKIENWVFSFHNSSLKN